MRMRDFIKKISTEAYIVPIAVSLFLMPVFWNPSFLFSFTQGKEILFRIILLGTLLIFVPIIIYKKDYKLRNILRSPIFILLLLQISIYAITNAFSSTPLVTLHGTYSRGFGMIMELFLFAFVIY